MSTDQLTTLRKALAINMEKDIYGTFAEIGAGQEVARHFFQAGFASNTVAKTMSAYDKVFSDAIYGKGSRFVSQDRLNRMLEHEYILIEERLKEQRGDSTNFFAFANTVATSSHETPSGCHAWMGIHYQAKPGGPTNKITLHVRMLDRARLQQTEALGILGVNLIFAAQYLTDLAVSDFVPSLIENLGIDRVDIDYLSFDGPGLHHVDNRLLSLELVKQDLTRAIMFDADGHPQQPSDTLYGCPLIIQRGTFRPITNTNLEILEKSLSQLKTCEGLGQREPVALFELDMNQLSEGGLDSQDFLDRVDTINCTGQKVLVTNFKSFSQLRKYLRLCTSNQIGIVVGASSLEWIFDESTYSNLEAGLMEEMGQLFDKKTKLYVFPYKSGDTCLTAQVFSPDVNVSHIYQHLAENKFVLDISDCGELDTSVDAGSVRKMLADKTSDWEKLVPKNVALLIKKKGLFGYHN